MKELSKSAKVAKEVAIISFSLIIVLTTLLLIANGVYSYKQRAGITKEFRDFLDAGDRFTSEHYLKHLAEYHNEPKVVEGKDAEE